MKIKDYIQTRVTNHRVMAEKLYALTRKPVDEPIWGVQLLERYSPKEAARLMQEGINSYIARQTAIDMTYNAEVKSVLKTAYLTTLPDAVRNFQAPADYSAQIGNAIAYLNAAGDKLTDAEAFEILKPFFNSWGKMHMFEGIIMHNSAPGEDNVYAVRKRFPNALGGVLNISDAHEKLFNEANRVAENLFLSKKQTTMTGYLAGFSFDGAVVCDSYEDAAAQDRIIELADKIDQFSVNGALMAAGGNSEDSILTPEVAAFVRDKNKNSIWE